MISYYRRRGGIETVGSSVAASDESAYVGIDCLCENEKCNINTLNK